MRTVQMTLDDDLVETVDRISKRLKTTRSAFTRQALREALVALNMSSLEQKHRAGYMQHAPGREEFSVWTDEQAWGDL